MNNQQSQQKVQTLQEKIATLRTALSEIGSTAATALIDEGVSGWDEGGRLGDALLGIKDIVEDVLTDEGRQILKKQYGIGDQKEKDQS